MSTENPSIAPRATFYEIAQRLLTWAKTAARPLPWRFTDENGQRDPYRVWIAEIMLQQTQVVAVIPYYARWLARFPTVQTLATAPQSDVLKAWEGLGYYARARNLHRAAQLIVERYNGLLPNTREELLALPGIGRYTAGAILSLAFGQRAAALDGNLKRVLSRVFNVETPLGQTSTENLLWALSETLVDVLDEDAEAGPVNEALMDLGADVCIPQNPTCERCPLLGACQAQKAGVQNARPVRLPRKTLPHFDVACGLIWNDAGQLLIAQRPQGGMLGGLWEFPGGKMEDGESLEECLHREIAEELAIQIHVEEKLTVIEHAYTHFRITLHAFRCRHAQGEPQAIGVANWAWVAPSELARYAFPVTDLKIISFMFENK